MLAVLACPHRVALLSFLKGDTLPGKGRLSGLSDAATVRIKFARPATPQGSLAVAAKEVQRLQTVVRETSLVSAHSRKQSQAVSGRAQDRAGLPGRAHDGRFASYCFAGFCTG